MTPEPLRPTPPTTGFAKRVGLAIGPLALLAFALVPAPGGIPEAAWRTTGVLALMAAWWATEAVPQPVTSLLPVLLFPVLGIASLESAAAAYAHPLVFLFLGGFLLAAAFERSGMHRRIALLALRLTGPRPAAVVLGVMAATAGVSMWVNNTAAALMMMPVALSLAALARPSEEERARGRPPALATALVLGVAYAAAIGGIGTLVGTPANALFAAYLEETQGIRVTFADWMIVGAPLMLALLAFAWLALTRGAIRVGRAEIVGGREWIREELANLGRARPAEKRLATLFFLTVGAWVALPFARGIPITDAGIAVLSAILLFLVPAGTGARVALLDWPTAARIPWDTLLLFGGGLSLAEAITTSGLASALGAGLAALAAFPALLVLAIVAGAVVLLSEFASNTATAASLLPVGAAVAAALGVEPAFVAMPIAIAASGGFVMPVATPPNALAFGTKLAPVSVMLRAGIVLDALFAVAALAAGPAAAWLFPG